MEKAVMLEYAYNASPEKNLESNYFKGRDEILVL